MKNSNALVFDYANLMYSDKFVKGLKFEELKNYQNMILKAHQEIISDIDNDILGFYSLPEKSTEHISSYINSLGNKFDTFVVLGIGGSALGNTAVYNALRTPSGLKNKLYVADNVDPYLLEDILSKINLNKTLFNVITKSGSTAETMAVYMIVLDILQKNFPKDYKERIIITTDAEKGFLRQKIRSEGFKDFIVPDNVGGRFSVLTDVGLVSSAFTGINIDDLLAGAAFMKEKCLNEDIIKNPAYLNGLIHYDLMKKGYNISVMMPYSNPLYDFADWYRQLWAESLGKRYDVTGNEICVGQTPVKALGTTDQHSQVQLYKEGPDDKIFTFMTVENYKHDFKIPELMTDRPEVNYLNSKLLSSLLNNEALATEIALTDSGKPNCNLIFPELNEFTIGQFIFMYEVQTVFTGKLLEVNPLDQPGVEAGKIATYALMGKKGFEKQKTEIDNYIKEKAERKFII